MSSSALVIYWRSLTWAQLHGIYNKINIYSRDANTFPACCQIWIKSSSPIRITTSYPTCSNTIQEDDWRICIVKKLFNPYLEMSLNHENAIGLHTRDNGWGKTHIFCPKQVSITALCNCPFFSSFSTSLKSNLRTVLTTQNTTENYTVLSPTHKTRLHFNQMYF